MTFASSDDIFEFLLGFVNVEKGQKTEFKLDRMALLCRRLGEPQNAFRSIHVAGSKGKGSVSVMAARILQAAGLRTGLYTSPHLLRWKERISLAGDEMEEALLVAAMEEVLPLVEGRSPADFPGNELPTFFELCTLVGFCAFRRAGCEAVVVETGLGGRLDSTNVVPSEASVITPIELEHTEWLGDTIPKIAFEKAGIIKAGRPCFLSAQSPEAAEVFAKTCVERNSPLREAGKLVRISGTEPTAGGTRAVLDFGTDEKLAGRFPSPLEVATPFIGAVQAENMALASLAAAETEASVDGTALVLGLARASLPARFQVLKLDTPVVLDGAHTPNSVRLTIESFEVLFPGPKALLFGCASDKNHAEMAALLARRFDRITVTRPGSFKRSEPDAVYASFLKHNASTRLVADTERAVRQAADGAFALRLPLLVTGSFYLCAEALGLLAPGNAGGQR